MVNNVRLHYVEEGEGPLVILLHGFPDFWYGWRMQIPVLAKKYHVVAPDMRGYNLSERPPRVADYRLDVLISDIRALIKSFGVDKAMVVAHDFGGAVAWGLAARHPELVAKLVVLNAPHPAAMTAALRAFDLRQLKKSYYAFFFQLPRIPEWFIRRDLAGFFRRVFGGLLRTDAEAAQYVNAYSRVGVLTAAINYYRAAARYPRDLELRGARPIVLPTLMIWGEQDTTLEADLARRSREYCDGLKIIYDPGSGHWVQVENSGLVNARLMEFFKA